MMRLLSMKGKVLVAVLISLLLVGGTTAVMAATPGGQSFVRSLTGAKPTANSSVNVAAHTETGKTNVNVQVNTNTQGQGNNGDINCQVQADTQGVAAKFSLKNSSEAIEVICSLHDGTFTGTVNVSVDINVAGISVLVDGTNVSVSVGDDINVNVGTTVTSAHAFTFSEIEQVLTVAQHLAAHNHTKLTNSNVRSFVAIAIKGCKSTTMAACLKVIVNASASGNNGIPKVPPVVPTIPVIPTPTIPHP